MPSEGENNKRHRQTVVVTGHNSTNTSRHGKTRHDTTRHATTLHRPYRCKVEATDVE